MKDFFKIYPAADTPFMCFKNLPQIYYKYNADAKE